jgi:hypothetical protein
MTGQKPARTCATCRLDGGWHYDDEGRATRCPNYSAAALQAEAQKLTAVQADARTEALRRIITDAAQRLPVLSANSIQDELEAAQVDGGGAVGAAFTWAARKGYIEATGRLIPSTRKATNGHRIFEYRSLVHRRKSA